MDRSAKEKQSHSPVQKSKAPPNRMRKWVIALVVVISGLVGGAMAARRAKARLPGYIRERIVSTLRQHFASDVQFSDLQVSLYPRIIIRGENLVFRLHGRTDVPPLIALKSVSTEINFMDIFRSTHHVHRITVVGLTITTPPTGPNAPKPKNLKHQPKEPPPYKVVVDEIVADGTELDMLVRDPNKPPHVFHIRSLRLHHAGLGQPMDYEATLTNPVPEGLIVSRGSFGPWQRDEPSLTPLNGTYTFDNVDLSTIHGLSGMLTSKGKFLGILERIEVDGQTSTPDFSLGINGNPVPLETQFHAIVDGTTGNTMLDPVNAKLLNTEIVARGGVFRVPGQLYRRVELEADTKHGRLEDMLELAMKTEHPSMTGDVNFHTLIDIPPGKSVIADRLKLDGRFQIDSARFSQLNIQSKIATLSHLGSGDHDREAETPGGVASNFAGKFVLADGTMTLSDLSFDVPGASVDLDGTYSLRDQAVDFTGALRLEAKLSELTTGWKALLLRPFDRLFEKDGAGTYVPIKITGTGSAPHFGVDTHRLF
jgi:hypothetical protein